MSLFLRRGAAGVFCFFFVASELPDKGRTGEGREESLGAGVLKTVTVCRDVLRRGGQDAIDAGGRV